MIDMSADSPSPYPPPARGGGILVFPPCQLDSTGDPLPPLRGGQGGGVSGIYVILDNQGFLNTIHVS